MYSQLLDDEDHSVLQKSRAASPARAPLTSSSIGALPIRRRTQAGTEVLDIHIMLDSYNVMIRALDNGRTSKCVVQIEPRKIWGWSEICRNVRFQGESVQRAAQRIQARSANYRNARNGHGLTRSGLQRTREGSVNWNIARESASSSSTIRRMCQILFIDVSEVQNEQPCEEGGVEQLEPSAAEKDEIAWKPPIFQNRFDNKRDFELQVLQIPELTKIGPCKV